MLNQKPVEENGISLLQALLRHLPAGTEVNHKENAIRTVAVSGEIRNRHLQIITLIARLGKLLLAFASEIFLFLVP
jgi:hypothetical protein